MTPSLYTGQLCSPRLRGPGRPLCVQCTPLPHHCKAALLTSSAWPRTTSLCTPWPHHCTRCTPHSVHKAALLTSLAWPRTTSLCTPWPHLCTHCTVYTRHLCSPRRRGLGRPLWSWAPGFRPGWCSAWFPRAADFRFLGGGVLFEPCSFNCARKRSARRQTLQWFNGCWWARKFLSRKTWKPFNNKVFVTPLYRVPVLEIIIIVRDPLERIISF